MVPIDTVRSKGNIAMWWWPTAWGTDEAPTVPDDALSQMLLALATGAGYAAALVTGAIRELTATEIVGFANPVFTDTHWEQSTDKVIFDFTTEVGTISPLEVFCAPQDGILLPNDRDVDIGQVDALITAFTTGGVCNLAGQEFKRCAGAYRNSTGAIGSKPGGV